MLARGYTPQFAEQIYQQILGFGSYGFPESHAASFALLAYISAWLRCHEPAAFVAGLLNSWPMGFYAPAQLVNDARRNGVSFLPVDVQTSDWYCTLERETAEQPGVRLGLRLITGLVEKEGAAIVKARAHGLFASVDELAHRAALTRRSLDALARAGALNPSPNTGAQLTGRLTELNACRVLWREPRHLSRALLCRAPAKPKKLPRTTQALA